jgi:tRNA A37 threonylcarbamoyltransferase TsaD
MRLDDPGRNPSNCSILLSAFVQVCLSLLACGKYGLKLTYTPDNAAMIAWTAVLRLRAGARGERYNTAVRAQWSLEDLYDDLQPEQS